MQIGNKGLELIKKYEGLRLTAYKCPAGVWTIGYGHTAGVKSGDKITKEQAEELLKKDLQIYVNHVNNLHMSFNQNQFDALVSFCYNLGPGCLSSLIRNRTFQQIADAMRLYNKAAGKVLPGLVKRREEERALFLTPINQPINKLPYNVKTKTVLNIRKGPNAMSAVIRTVPAGTILKVWAICTDKHLTWGKNGEEYFCLNYCDKV
jgi:lysozyme